METVLPELKNTNRKESCLYKLSRRETGKTGNGQRREVDNNNEVEVVADRRGHEDH